MVFRKENKVKKDFRKRLKYNLPYIKSEKKIFQIAVLFVSWHIALMNNNILNWSQLDWSRFQELCIYIAQEEYRNLRLEEYLKRGHKQDGIDLISTNQANQCIAIQCKKVEQLTTTELNKIQNEFLDGQFVGKTSLFILATTADLQSPKLQKHLFDQKDV